MKKTSFIDEKDWFFFFAIKDSLRFGFINSKPSIIIFDLLQIGF